MKTFCVAVSLSLAFIPSILLAQNNTYDGIWVGTAIENGSSEDCDGVTPVVIKVNGTQIQGTAFDDESDEGEYVMLTGVLNNDSTISDGVFNDGFSNVGTFTGTFSGNTAQITSDDPSLPGCTSSLPLTRHVSFVSGFNDSWSGAYSLTQGDCDNGEGAELILVRTATSAGSNFKGSVIATDGMVFLVQILTDKDGVISEGSYGTADTAFGTLSGEIDDESGHGEWSGDGCLGNFEISLISIAEEEEPETDNKPAGAVPPATKIISSNGSVSSASLAIGAYINSGTPVYANTFKAGDSVTIIGEATPDVNDIGKNGVLYAAVASLVNGKVTFSFVNIDGTLEPWDLSLGGLGAATATSPLQAGQGLTIFEGNLVAGIHKIALAYKASGGPLIYTGKAVKIAVTQ